MEEKVSIQELSLRFSCLIIDFCKKIHSNDKWISNQLIRSGTAIGALIMEAQNAESRRDFIHKMKIAAKEASETEYWLQLYQMNINTLSTVELVDKIIKIKMMLNKIIATASKNQNKNEQK